MKDESKVKKYKLQLHKNVHVIFVLVMTYEVLRDRACSTMPHTDRVPTTFKMIHSKMRHTYFLQMS